MATQGKIEIIIKIDRIPQARKLDNGVVFDVVCDKMTVNIFLQTKRWKKILEAKEKYPVWEANITGVMDNPTAKGFMLNNAIVQILQKKAKAQKTTDSGSSSSSDGATSESIEHSNSDLAE
jgi:hypothetical protein